jgi:hypothetical protein
VHWHDPSLVQFHRRWEYLSLLQMPVLRHCRGFYCVFVFLCFSVFFVSDVNLGKMIGRTDGMSFDEARF